MNAPTGTISPSTSPFAFDNTYARQLEGFYVDWQAAPAPAPRFLAFNRALAAELGVDADRLESAEGLAIFAGNALPAGAMPIAQAYAGHQFGGFSPSLGDGRALLLGEIVDTAGRRRDIQLKGSGRTPFSRGGDGKAAVGPVLREYLMGEAMHALAIPTTRALAAVATGEPVLREAVLPGAILTRVAASHIRVGTFQYFAVRKDWERVGRLAEYVIARHYPAAAAADNPVLALFEAVVDAQAKLVAKWMHVGFIHGVMNTDNMALSGETIDYGPCAFMDRYAPATVFSSIDSHGRYAYGNQPVIAQWNLTRFAETLVAIVDDDETQAVALLTAAIKGYQATYMGHWLAGMRAKIGLTSARDGDLDLINGLFGAIEGQGVDYTLLFRRLSDAVRGDEGPVRALFNDQAAYDAWVPGWQARLAEETAAPAERAAAMDRVNPIYIARNHRVEEALAGAFAGDMAPFERLLAVVRQPYDEIAGNEAYAEPAPGDGQPHVTFCGT